MLNQTPTPELYRQRESLYAARDKALSLDERLTIKKEMARLARLITARELPTRYPDYRGGLHLWTANVDALATVREFCGYSKDPFGPVYRQLPKWRLVDEMKKLPLLEGHTYRVYLVYRAEDGHRTFKRLEAIDADALTAPLGNALKLGELEL